MKSKAKLWDELVTSVRANGRVKYRAPLDYRATEVPAEVMPDGRIRVELTIPADGEWEAETLIRYAWLGDAAASGNHVSRLSPVEN